MEVILLERVGKLGQMGDTVRVKDGYARNFLLPGGKALRATEANKARFESQRAQLETRNLESRNEAAAVAEKLDGQVFVIIRQAGETGHLYGSVSPRDIAAAVTAGGFSAMRNQIVLKTPIKSLGLHEVPVHLHPEIEALDLPSMSPAPPTEAERQAKGEALNVVEETSMDDLGLEVGAALAEAEWQPRRRIEEQAPRQRSSSVRWRQGRVRKAALRSRRADRRYLRPRATR